MSKLKISEDVFLGKQELNRFRRFLSEDGYQKAIQQIAGSYGVVNSVLDVNFDSLRIIQGSTPTDFTLKAGLAIDKNSNFITNETDLVDIISIPTDNVFRYITAHYVVSNVEKGTLSIAIDGTLTGTGTLFTEVLRGQPNFPVKIKFPNSGSNLGEYEVLKVNSDGSAQIIGASFTVETLQTYIVVGTFTAGKSIPSGDKDIYEYDYFRLAFLAGLTATTNTEFYLAKVKSDGSTTVIADLRSTNIFTI